MNRTDLRLAVITLSAHIPDLADDDGWDEALRLRALIAGLQAGGYQVAGVLGADAQLPERLAALAPDVLIVDALRLREHPTHFNVAETLEAARRTGAKLTYCTHLSHELGHAELEAGLPDNVRVAWDGLVLEF